MCIMGQKINFNPLPLRRGRHRLICRSIRHKQFQSTPSTQRETDSVMLPWVPGNYFNPLPLRRGRHYIGAAGSALTDFNPLPLRRGRHVCSLRSCALSSYFNPLPLRRGRHLKCHIIVFLLQFQSTPSTQRETALNSLSCSILLVFQSTPSTQRETISANLIALSGRFQSTPSTQRETAKINKILYSNPKNIVENTKLYISNTQQHTCRAHYPLPNYLSASANLPEIPCSLRIRTSTFPRQALLLA